MPYREIKDSEKVINGVSYDGVKRSLESIPTKANKGLVALSPSFSLFFPSNYIRFVYSVLRIRDIYPGSRILSIPDLSSKNSKKEEGGSKLENIFIV
jgi:hypothetical protein